MQFLRCLINYKNIYRTRYYSQYNIGIDYQELLLLKSYMEPNLVRIEKSTNTLMTYQSVVTNSV